MASRALTIRPIIGAFAYFLRAGDTVDSITVAAETVVSPAAGKPDNSPTTNWADLGVVKAATPSVEEKKSTYLKPLPSGGHEQVEERQVVADYLTLDLENLTDIALEMMFGIGKITQGTPQIPGNVLDRKVQGWLKLQGRKTDAADLFVIDLWVEARLASIPKIEANPVTASIRFQKMYSTLNTINFPA